MSASLQYQDFVPISNATLSSRVPLYTDVFLKATASAPAVLFFRGQEQPDSGSLENLIANRESKLFVRSSDLKEYQRYLRENLTTLLEQCDENTAASTLNAVVRDVLNLSFSDGKTQEIVANSKLIASAVCRSIRPDTLTVRQLSSVLHHDYATFTHVSNVAMYCAFFAKSLTFSEVDVENIVVGGLLHDIGKLKIPEKILIKPAKLDESEFTEIQKHPTLGYQELCERNDLSFAQLMMCYQHHEWIDGSGYPVGITKKELHPWSMLCAIVDVFEALTSHRPYRQPLPYRVALDIMNKGRGTQFDPELLDHWNSMVFNTSQNNVISAAMCS